MKHKQRLCLSTLMKEFHYLEMTALNIIYQV